MILRRLQDSRFSEVLPEWTDGIAVLIGGGPSLTTEHVELVRQAHVAGILWCIAINDAYLLAPWADVNYFADTAFWQWHTDGTPKPLLGLSAKAVKARFATFAGQKCSIEQGGTQIEDDAVHVLRNALGKGVNRTGLSHDPQAIVPAYHGGFQALNIAILAGAKTVILLGYDGKATNDGKTHFHGGHPGKVAMPTVYQLYKRSFSAVEHDIEAAGVRVVNCSPGSAIDSFEKMNINEALGRVTA